MILPVNIPIRNYYKPSFKRTHNEIPEDLRFYKQKTGDFAFCQIDGLTCPACGAEMLSQSTYNDIALDISTANPQECLQILKKHRKYMVPVKRSIFERVLTLQAKEPYKSMPEILNDMDLKENEQMLQSQAQVLKRMSDIVKAAGDKKIIERQKKMFSRLKECRTGLPKQEKAIFDDILFFYEDQLKTRKHPISTGKLISRIKASGFEDEKFTRLIISRIDKDKDCPEYDLLSTISSALGHLSDVNDSRKIRRTNQIIVQEKKEYLLSKEREKLEEIRAVAKGLTETEAASVNEIINRACEKIETQKSTIGRKALLNQIRELNLSSPEIMDKITTIANSKIEDQDNYRAYILPPKYKQGVENASYSFSREDLIYKIKKSKLEDEKLKRQLLTIAENLPSAKTEEKYNEITNLLDYDKKCKEPETSRLVASAFLQGSVANTDHFEAVNGENKGLDIVINYVGMHEDCNCKKKHKPPIAWFREEPKRAIYLKKYLAQAQEHIDSGKVSDIRYLNYTQQIIDRVYNSTNGQIDLTAVK